jgi:hypothetical protein
MSIKLSGILTVCAIAVVACASPYVPPSSGPTARVKFVGNHYYAYIDEGGTCSTRKFVPKDAWPSSYVRAGQRLWLEQGIDTSGTAYGYTCGFVFSFSPEADTTYISEYTNQNRQCQVKLYRLTASGEKVIERSVRREKNRLCW